MKFIGHIKDNIFHSICLHQIKIVFTQSLGTTVGHQHGFKIFIECGNESLIRLTIGNPNIASATYYSKQSRVE